MYGDITNSFLTPTMQHLPAVQQPDSVRGLAAEGVEEEPVYVNVKQSNRILKQLIARLKLEDHLRLRLHGNLPHIDSSLQSLSTSSEQNDLSQHNDQNSAARLTPPPNQTHSDRNTAIKTVKDHAVAHGYKIKIQTTSKPSGLNPNPKVWLRCHRGGYRRGRKGGKQVIGCPFQVVVSEKSPGWVVKVLNANHNHGANGALEG